MDLGKLPIPQTYYTPRNLNPMYIYIYIYRKSTKTRLLDGGNSNILYMFTPIWGNDPI